MKKSTRIIYKIFTWQTGNTYHVSKRPVNNTKNALFSGRYASRSGMNKAAKRLHRAEPDTTAFERNTNPNLIK